MTGIADMRHRLVVEEPTRTDDDAGGASVGWTAVATLWAAIEELGGIEQREGDAMTASRRVRITLRFQDALDPSQRLRMGSRIFEIIAITGSIGDRLVLDCIERI